MSAITQIKNSIKIFYENHEDKVKFLIVGGWNTLFGYAVFIVLYYNLHSLTHYILILIINYLISISNAYLTYKFIVFKTRGNYLKEYLKFYLVYGLAFIINLLLLIISAEILHLNILFSQTAIVFITAIISYTGHKGFSFKTSDGSAE